MHAMSRPPQLFRQCPRCLATRLYLKADDVLVFFQVGKDDRVVPLDQTAPPVLHDETTLYCASCSWSGSRTDLL